MTQSDCNSSGARIIDAMIELAGAAKSHRMIIAGSDSSEVLLGLHRRGCSRVATTKTCRAPRCQYDVAPLTFFRKRG
jgi:hypothetical protein